MSSAAEAVEDNEEQPFFDPGLPRCSLCHRTHAMKRCSIFKSMKPTQRKQVARAHEHCMNFRQTFTPLSSVWSTARVSTTQGPTIHYFIASLDELTHLQPLQATDTAAALFRQLIHLISTFPSQL